jgi:hypothetical protein
MKERLKEYNRKLRMLLKSQQNANNKIAAIGAVAVPLSRYSLVSLIGD